MSDDAGTAKPKMTKRLSKYKEVRQEVCAFCHCTFIPFKSQCRCQCMVGSSEVKHLQSEVSELRAILREIEWGKMSSDPAAQFVASITPELHERIQKALGESDE